MTYVIKYQLIIDYVGCYYVENSWIMLKIHELCWLLFCYQLIIDFYFFVTCKQIARYSGSNRLTLLRLVANSGTIAPIAARKGQTLFSIARNFFRDFNI